MESQPLTPAQLTETTGTTTGETKTPRRVWTARLSQSLGLPRRRIQKLLEDGAPDATDAEVNADWSAHESRWRTWILSSPRWRSLSRRLRTPTDLDAGHRQAAPGAASGGDVARELSALDLEKYLKAKADRERSELALYRERGEVLDRGLAMALLTSALQTLQALYAELPAHLAASAPPEERERLRALAAAVVAAQRPRLEATVKTLWRQQAPPLMNKANPS